jgi:hypothetical protein
MFGLSVVFDGSEILHEVKIRAIVKSELLFIKFSPALF